MTYTLRKAIASEAKPLVALYSESGCGKTHSSLLLAKGFCGDMSKVVMIETESGRGEAWANDPVVGGYSIISIRSDFSPKNYGAAISDAEKAGAQVLIIDSASHEWEGVGGVLSMAADNEAAGKKGPLVWQKPKMDHQREFVLRLTQTPIPLVIVCLRAKYVMEQVPGSKDWRRSKDLSPKQSEDILFEMFVHGWIDREHVCHVTKYTIDSMRPVFVDGERISVQTGERLASWASASSAKAAGARPSESQKGIQDLGEGYISPDQVTYLGDLIRENNLNLKSLLLKAEVPSLAMLRKEDYARAKAGIEAAIEARK